METVRGAALAVLTSVVSQRGVSARSLQELTGESAGAVSQAVDELLAREWIERTGRDGFAVTVEGLGAFYRTLGEIRDTLVPDQAAAMLPFTIKTVWRECLCFNYAVDPDALRGLVPPAFDLVTRKGRALVSVTAAALSSLRPRGLPELVGQSFCHVTYRVVVRFKNAQGETRTGYDFSASVTNSEVLSRIGNSVTEFKFHGFRTGSITFLREGSKLVLGAEVPGGDLDLVATADTATGSDRPPAGSLFPDRAELDREVIDHSDAFGHEEGAGHVYVLRIDRDPWNYRFVEPAGLYMAYFRDGKHFDPSTATLDSVLHCQNVRYTWEPLRREALASVTG